MFTRNGYWVKKNDDGSVRVLLMVKNEYDDFYYRDGRWQPAIYYRTCADVGWSDEWDRVSEEEAEKAMEALDDRDAEEAE